MTEQDWVRKGVPLSNTTIAAILSKETQSEVFLGLHYSEEPQVADFAPRDGNCESSPCSTAVELMLEDAKGGTDSNKHNTCCRP